MLTLIGAKATRARRVFWLLEELGLDYVHDPLPPRDPGLARYTTSGKVPVLIDGDAVLTDSVAILHYLADREGKFTFPAGTIERARQDGLTFRIMDELEGPLWMRSKHAFILPEEMRVPAIKESLGWEFGEAARGLAADLGEGPFLMGETMTVADIVLTHCLGWAGMAKFPALPPELDAYFERMTARPAAAKAYA